MNSIDPKIEYSKENKKLVCCRTLSVWNKDTLPRPFRDCHSTKSGVWAKLQILSGSLVMEFLNSKKEVIKQCKYTVENQPELIEPQQYHRIASRSQDLTCQLSFYSEES